MPPKRELSLEQIQEIRALRGQLPAAEAKKRFGIGTTRLYKIWRDESGSGGARTTGAEPAAYPSEASPLPVSLPGLSAGVEQRGGAPDNQPTVADFYNRLSRLEARAAQTTDLLAQVLAELSHSDDDESDLLEELVAAERDARRAEIAEQVQATRHEQTETRMDLQKLGQMVETAQKWLYILPAAVLVWKVAATTWRNTSVPRTPAPVGRDAQAKPQHTAVPPPHAKPGDPLYME